MKMSHLFSHRIVAYNVDMEIAARIERKERGNRWEFSSVE
jgi:hypothetical protein